MDRAELGREFYELGLRLGGLGPVLIGCGGGPLAKVLARAAGCGAALAGGEVKFHDGDCAACGAWLAKYYEFPASIFVRQEGTEIGLFLPDQPEQRFSLRYTQGIDPACTGEWDLLTGADCAWAANRAGEYQGDLGPACARGPAALTLAMERLGYEVSSEPAPGVPLFETDREGFALRVEEDGGTVSPEGSDALEGLTGYVRKPEAIPAFRPEKDGKTQS